jgi:serine/threonine protein kinase
MESVLRVARARALALEEGLIEKHEFAIGDRITLGDGLFCVGVFRVKSENQAIKVLHNFSDCKAEWELLSLFDHPNVVRCVGQPVFDITTPFFRMELVRGWNLLDILTKGMTEPGPVLSTVGMRHVLLCVALALQHIHSRGVVHRDVKTENILLNVKKPRQVNESTIVKLCDFNLAHRVTEPVPHFGGSPPCISPEVHFGEVDAIGPKTDIFGFGALSFALVTGLMTFNAKMLENYKKNWSWCQTRIADDPGYAAQPSLRSLTLACLSWECSDRPDSDGLVKSSYFVRRSPATRKAREARCQKS